MDVETALCDYCAYLSIILTSVFLAPIYNSQNVTVLYDGPGTMTIWWEVCIDLLWIATLT